MRKSFVLTVLCTALVLLSGCGNDNTPRADHVIILGFDAMSARALQRAETPSFNYMIENGAVSIHTRCIRETTSSQNWMTMVSAAPQEMHGVITNGWKPGEEGNLEPALTNKIGLFPTIFDHIRAQKPHIRQYAFIEWTNESRMYDESVFDKICILNRDTTMHETDDVIRKAFSTYLEDRPEMMFLSMDITDHMGHSFGHESDEYLATVSEMDAFVGDFVHELESRGWMDNTVIIVTADHGGIKFGHGGDTMEEYEIPIILFGKGVTKGKVMKNTNMIYDVGATAAGLLGVELPWECRGKMLVEAFSPSLSDDVYVPMPMVRPFEGKASGDVTMTCDTDGAQIFYTLDGTEPDGNSIRYDGPFRLDKAAHIRSVAYKNGCRSIESENYLYPDGNEPPVFFKLYRGYMEHKLPDFTKFGAPSETGYINSFDIKELNVAGQDHFAVLFSSHLIIGEEADYVFELKSDDGANLYVDDKLIVNNESSHSTRNVAVGTVRLGAGRHVLRIEYFDDCKSEDLSLRFKKDGDSFTPVLPSSLDR